MFTTLISLNSQSSILYKLLLMLH